MCFHRNSSLVYSTHRKEGQHLAMAGQISVTALCLKDPADMSVYLLKC